MPGACLYGIGMSLHKTLVTGVFWGRRFLRLPIPAVVAVAAAGATDGFAVSLTAEGGEAFCIWTSAVPSRDSSIFDLPYKDLLHRTSAANGVRRNESHGHSSTFNRIRLPCRTCSAVNARPQVLHLQRVDRDVAEVAPAFAVSAPLGRNASPNSPPHSGH